MPRAVASWSQTHHSPDNPPRRGAQKEDAIAYLDAVKLRYEGTPDTYSDFLEVMQGFKSQRVDTPGVIDRVMQLFRGDRELVLGFNQFLPPGYVIEFSEGDGEEPALSGPRGSR